MKVGVIGDLHGHDTWKKFVNDLSIDLWIFLADYVDSMEVKSEQIYGNLMDIMEYKKNNMDKVILLLGNHDLEYFYGPSDNEIPRCKGFMVEMLYNLHFLFRENRKLFQFAHQIGNHLFTHAGISDVWYDKHRDTIKEIWERLSHKDDRTGVPIADVINAIAETHHRNILFEVGEARGGSFGRIGGPLWACYKETKFGVLKGYHHVCGHTSKDDIERIDFDVNTSITYCDCLGTQEKFLSIEI